MSCYIRLVKLLALNNPDCYIKLHRLNKTIYKFLHSEEIWNHVVKVFTIVGEEPNYTGILITTHRLFGKHHRDEDKPAVIGTAGNKQWWQRGERHRDGDEPAIIYPSGIEVWYQRGKIHRDGDKPAAIHSDDRKDWFQHGKRHRDRDKPAIIPSDDTEKWYKNGVQYTPSQ